MPEELAAVHRPGKPPGPDFYLPGVYSPRRVGSQILVLRFPHFLHGPSSGEEQ